MEDITRSAAKFGRFWAEVIQGCHLIEPVIKTVAYFLMALAYAIMIFAH